MGILHEYCTYFSYSYSPSFSFHSGLFLWRDPDYNERRVNLLTWKKGIHIWACLSLQSLLDISMILRSVYIARTCFLYATTLLSWTCLIVTPFTTLKASGCLSTSLYLYSVDRTCDHNVFCIYVWFCVQSFYWPSLCVRPQSRSVSTWLTMFQNNTNLTPLQFILFSTSLRNTNLLFALLSCT